MRGRSLRAGVALCVVALAPLLVACDTEDVAVEYPPPMADIAVGDVHSCAVSRVGEIYCWGDNAWGQLGTGDTELRRFATLIGSPGDFTAVAAGGIHTCALTGDGTAYCWGGNYAEQAGHTGTSRVVSPRPVDTSVPFTAITAGSGHTCGLDSEGVAYCWGANLYGQTGDGSLSASVPTPTPVATALRFRAINAGGYHTCGIAMSGDAYCWGANNVAQLGAGIHGDPEPAPVAVDAPFTFEAIAAGFGHSCGVRTGGDAYCWGQNRFGELGVYGLGEGPVAASPVPVIAFGERYARVSAGTSYTCGLRTQGEMHCWGRGVEGQLGSGQMVNTAVRHLVLPEPGRVKTAGSGAFRVVDAGGITHVCALTVEGRPLCWGQGEEGQLGTGEWFTMVPQHVLLHEP